MWGAQMGKYKVDESKLTGLEIAIVGMDCRMPGADNVREFWENIVNGKEVFYMLDDEHVKQVFEVGIEHIEHKK